MQKRTKTLAAAGLGVVLLGGLYYAFDHGDIHPSDAINPAYWLRRARGEDLYDAHTHLLGHGNRNLKEVALTIDDGPHNGTGDQILDILKQRGIHATFFVVGRRMKERPDLVQRMVNEGNEVGNHTENHYRLDSLRPDQARREINDNDINFYRITGEHMSVLRPPGMRYTPSVLSVADKLNYTIIGWNCAAKDFDEVTPDYIISSVLKHVENGSIILLHDDRPGTVVALPRVLDALTQQGYRFVTISDMLAHLPKPVTVESNAKSTKTS